MAVRRAVRKYDDILSFLKDYESTIKDGAVFLPAATLKGELAAEVRLDFVLPMVGRAGPVTAQVVHRSPAGVALRIPEMSKAVQDLFDRFFEEIESLREHFIAMSDVVPRAEHDAAMDALRAEVAEAVAASRAATTLLQSVQAELRKTQAALAAGESAVKVPAAQAVAAAPPPVSGPRPRGFAIPDVTDMQPVYSGDVATRSFRDGLIRLAIERRRGLMVINHSDGRVRYGFWDRGGPVGWRTDPLQDAEVLGVLLFRSEQITREQLQESLQFMEERDCRQGDAFIEMGVMSFPQLVMVLGKQVDFILQQILQGGDGQWAFYALDDLPERFLPPPLRVPSLLFRGLINQAKTMSLSAVRKTQAPNLDRYCSLSDGVRSILEEIKMSSGEAKFIQIMHSNSWRFRELFTVSPLSKAQTAALLWAMNELGFIEYASNEDLARKLARLTKRVRSKKKQLDRGTMFDLLEIHWICLPKEIEAAYNRVREEFDMSKVNIPIPDSLRGDADLIVSRMDEAYQMLCNDQSRREYRKKLIEPMMIAQSAELLSRKGEMAIMRRDRREACGCFAKALELIPTNAGYRDGLKRSTALL